MQIYSQRYTVEIFSHAKGIIMAYDGSTPLQAEIARLIKCSLKNQVKIASVTKQAKLDLGITSKARRLPTETKLQIYNHIVELYSQDDNEKSVEIISPTNNNDPVEIISQDNETEILECEITQQASVEINSQPSEHVEIFSQTGNNEYVELPSHTLNFDNVRIAFYIMRDSKRERQVISLDGFFINALASIKVSRKNAPQWVQAQVDNWTDFDSKLPVTRQVKYLIIREVVKGLSGSDDPFHFPIDD